MDLRLKHPFTSCVAGPTSCGKSYFVEKLILEGIKCCNTKFEDILWCYSGWHPDISSLSSIIKYQQGIEDITREDCTVPRLIIIDDLMRESGSSIVDLFTRGSHHSNTSVIFITQNIFHQSKGFRDISLNTHYLVLFKNPRDSAQIAHLARQIFPSGPKYIQEAYKDSTDRPHGYLLVDLTQSTPDHCRIRTNILGEKEPGYPVIYIPKDKNKKSSAK